jgi:L-aminopeptidase/D-esterase-like protein
MMAAMVPALAPGFRVGHWTDDAAETGCTVILPPPGNVTSCDVRGSSPSTRELEHLHPDRRLTEVHAVLLTGGSAFGLAAADGVVAWLAERGIGYRTAIAPVPIVPAAVIFDLRRGDPAVRPGPEAGHAACDAAAEGGVAGGRVGAGRGATVGKWAGPALGVPGGIGFHAAESEGETVGAAAVVNSVGDVLGADGAVLAGSRAPREGDAAHIPEPPEGELNPSTVLALVATTARIDKREARWLAARGSDGITIAVAPAHTRYDGDVTFAIAAPPAEDRETNIDLLGRLATQTVAGAVRAAVTGSPS